jgi:hypothetical protein
MKVLIFDENKQELIEKDIENELDTFYEIIGCRCIDIPRRKVGGKYFDIIVDDEGLLKDAPRCTAVDPNTLDSMLFGTLIFTNSDDEGNTVGLSDEDIKLIKGETMSGFNMHTFEHVTVIKVEY